MTAETSKQPDDLIEFVDDGPGLEIPAQSRVWNVLVVDDDDDVHQATRFALGQTEILGRSVRLIHAHSAAEARQILGDEADIAVALVDVVMETSDAGLKLVSDMRQDGRRETRIVLRTGQPGYAPELSVIAGYEIDDYRTKSELTRTRLLTVLTASIRAYDQICTINRSRAGLEMIVESATELFRRTNLELFSKGVLTQIASLLGITPNGIVCVGTDHGKPYAEGHIVSGTGRFGGHLGMSPAALNDPTLLQILEDARLSSQPVLRDHYMALCFRHMGGRELSVLIETTSEIASSDLALLKLFSTNIAIGFDNITLVERLDHLAYVDPVLDIPNLNAFEVALEERRKSPSPDARIALVSIDSYSSILATYGSRVAHLYLGEIYGALTSPCGAPITAARVGDSCFALLGKVDDFDEEQIARIFERSYCIDGIDIAATATAALLDLRDQYMDAPAIMRMANAALLHVIQTQPGHSVVYDAETQAHVEARIALQIGLKQAVKTGEGLCVHLQPKINLLTEEIVGAEALLRWTFEGQTVSPVRFIPIAEACGLSSDLTEFVVRAVGQWTAGRGVRPAIPVAVNLSMADLNHPAFAARLMKWMAEEGLSAENISFEVTEGIAMQDKPWAIEQVRILKAAGYRIALDDFGTGYSSLSYFSQLPIDTLKIDKSFVRGLDIRTARDSLAAIIVGMAGALGVDCVAEGIETEEQKQALQFLGCTIGQGFLFSRPLAMDAFDAQYGLSARGALEKPGAIAVGGGA